jgi:2-C-methyl-D-erythritol 4-phosphate cytidylyltransferase
VDGIRRIPVIVAGGKGCRMGSQTKKQYLMLDKIPVLTRTLMVFDRQGAMDDIVLVIPEEDREWIQKNVIRPYGFTRPVHLVSGGRTRQESVFNGIRKAGLLADAHDRTLVFIHDGVRPFVTRELIDHLMNTAIQKGGCIPVLAVTDTLKQVDSDRRILKTLNRDRIFRAQTPQVFRLDLILQALEHARATGFTGTDDASIMAHAGFVVHTITGSDVNIKLTTPHDLVLARQLINRQGKIIPKE